MDAEPISSHVAAKGDVSVALSRLTSKSGAEGQYFGDGVRIVNLRADYSCEPDGCFFTWSAVDDGRVTMIKSNDGEDVTELVGSPEMVLEVVSPSSVHKDKKVLRELYHKAGILEYWLVDARSEQLSFEILRSTPEGYVAAAERNGWLTSNVFRREFRLDRARNRIDLWDYTLHDRPLG
jgi:Uma2 family endonuclease